MNLFMLALYSFSVVIPGIMLDSLAYQLFNLIANSFPANTIIIHFAGMRELAYIKESHSLFWNLFRCNHSANRSCNCIILSAGRRIFFLIVSKTIPRNTKITAGPSIFSALRGIPNALQVVKIQLRLSWHWLPSSGNHRDSYSV